ncbi:MAG: phosphate signaling complex protein PhoU [Polyangiaceae bacterium]
MTHFEETLQRDVERIRSKVRDMAALAEGSLYGCMTALVQRNRQVAYSVILRDQRIDELDKEIDRLCLEFIVRQQPVAGTLRFVYAVIKINSELERVGDYAESMARQGLSLLALDVDVPLDRVQEIANKAIPMLHGAVEAFVSQEADLAKKTMESEEVVDRLRHQLSQDLIGLIQQGKMPLEALTPLMNIVNRLERVADQAKSICQETLYMCTGEYMKHAGSEMFRLLFVDEANACVSQMAEALGGMQQHPKFVFTSAGLERKPVDPATVLFLRDKGIDISRHGSKAVDQIPHLDHYQIIVALTKDAQRVFPPPPTKAVCLDWSLPDPSRVTGSPEEVRAAYEETYKFLKAHIRDLVQAILGDQSN